MDGKAAAQTVREVLEKYAGVADEVRDYAAGTAAGLLDDMQVSTCVSPISFLSARESVHVRADMLPTIGRRC